MKSCNNGQEEPRKNLAMSLEPPPVDEQLGRLPPLLQEEVMVEGATWYVKYTCLAAALWRAHQRTCSCERPGRVFSIFPPPSLLYFSRPSPVAHADSGLLAVWSPGRGIVQVCCALQMVVGHERVRRSGWQRLFGRAAPRNQQRGAVGPRLHPCAEERLGQWPRAASISINLAVFVRLSSPQG
jgi:hypothetical protein